MYFVVNERDGVKVYSAERVHRVCGFLFFGSEIIDEACIKPVNIAGIIRSPFEFKLDFTCTDPLYRIL